MKQNTCFFVIGQFLWDFLAFQICAQFWKFWKFHVLRELYWQVKLFWLRWVFFVLATERFVKSSQTKKFFLVTWTWISTSACSRKVLSAATIAPQNRVKNVLKSNFLFWWNFCHVLKIKPFNTFQKPKTNTEMILLIIFKISKTNNDFNYQISVVKYLNPLSLF